MKLWIYIVRRALLLVPVIVGVMTVTFLITSALPVTDRLVSELGPNKMGYAPTVPCANAQPPIPPDKCPKSGVVPNPNYQRGIQQLGLDQPLFVQWLIYVEHSLTLQWGATDAKSKATQVYALGGAVAITTVLGWYLPYTLELAALALLIILVLAIPIGNYSAVYRNRPLDQGARVLSFSGFAMPGFLLGVLLLFAATEATGGANAHFCGNLSTSFEQWYGSWPNGACFPTGRFPSWVGLHLQTSPTGFPIIDSLAHGDWWLAFDGFRRLLIPAFVIAYGSIAGILRFVRNSMLEVMNLDFVRTARAKGVPEPLVVNRHAGRNSLNVTITVLGLTFAAFIGGFPIIESVFHLQGIGLLLTYSIQPQFDFGLIFGTTLLFTIIVVIANITVDILYAYLDPRVRLG